MNAAYAMVLVLAFFLPGTVSARNLVRLRSIRHHTAELRLELVSEPSSLSLQVRDFQNHPRVTLSASRSPQGSSASRLCLQSGNQEVCAQLPAGLRRGDVLAVRQRGTSVQVLAHGELALDLPSAVSFQGSLWVSADDQGQPCLKAIGYQRLGPIVFGDDFMRTEEEAKSFGAWVPVSGTWNIHSVMETIRANPAARIRAGKIPVPDRSPNPFTLAGSSPAQKAMIVTGYPFWSDYRISVTTKPHTSTTGLVFAYQDPQNFWSVQWALTSTGTRPSPLRLIQTRGGKETQRAAVCLNGRSDNWYRLAAETRGTRISVSVDGVPVLNHRTLQCTGGKVGLLAQGTGETFFDDVSVRSVMECSPSLPELMKGAPGQASAWSLASGHEQPALIAETSQSTLPYGSPSWKPQRLTAHLGLPPNGAVSFNFSSDRSVMTTLTTTSQTTSLTLTNDGKLLQTTTLPFPTTTTQLTLDSTQLHTLRVFLDGRLALRYQNPKLPPLAGAVTLTAHTPKLQLYEMTFFQDEQRDWERPVDVKKFINDPFMQGWASNRYAWNRTKPRGTFPQTYVFAGDVYGAFSLETPIIHGLNYHFGHDNPSQAPPYTLQTQVDQPSKTATITLRKEKDALAIATLPNLSYKLIPGIEIIDEKIGKRPKTPDTPSWGTMTLHRDGYLLWLEHDGKTVFTASDQNPATGRTLTATIPHNLDFVHINLIREHVRDYLFDRAESDWTSTGRWEVTNRFACDPRWSHMNGESFGTAALWSKFNLLGDFTVECFAGMRMRQGPLKGNSKMNYPRVGDINVTLQARGEDLFSGYSLLIQKWDPKWSESITEFMRLNQTIQQYQGELIPSGRVQPPKKRIIPVDYDPGGRAVHGAWYALKIRKTGNRYQAWFDNHEIMDVTDPKPLSPQGQIALWTQNNSIVLARVKVNYRNLVPLTPMAKPASDTLPHLLLKDSPPYTSTLLPPLTEPPKLPTFTPWNGDQSADITILRKEGKDTIALFRNLNGGGDFGTRISLPDKNQLLDTHAIEFDFRCSPQAKVNLYLAPHDRLQPRFFVPLTGPQHDEADLLSLGKPITAPRENWTHVAIPLTRRIYQHCPWFKNHAADYLMLGMLHEGYLNAGLNGNQKGQWFAVKNLSIRTLTKTEAQALPEKQQFHLLPPTGKWGFNPIRLRLAGLPVFPPKLIANASLEIANRPFSSTIPDKNGRKSHFFYLNANNAMLQDDLLTLIPPELPFNTGTAYFKLIMQHPTQGEPFATTWSQIIDPSLDRTPPEPPRIHHTIALLDSPSKGLDDVKTNAFSSAEFFCRKTISPAGFPAAHTTARASGTRMATEFKLPQLDARDYPFLFLDLKLDHHTYASFLLRSSRGSAYLRLNDHKIPRQHDLGRINGFRDNHQWQTVNLPLLNLLEKIPSNRHSELRRLTHLALGDYGYAGTFPGASFHVSNLRFAKVVTATKDHPLNLTWQAKDLGGIAKYALKWSPNYHDEPELNHTQPQPRLTASDLPEGLMFLHLKACDHNGNWSATVHQPYVINNEQPKIMHLSPAPNAHAAPQTLTALISDISSRIVCDRVTMTCNGKPVTFRPHLLSVQTKDAASQQLTLDLLPILAQYRKTIPHDTPFTITLDGLATSLGTNLPPCVWNWTTDYQQDKQPPYPPSVSHSQTFRHYNSPLDRRTFQRAANTLSLITDDLTHSPCLQLKSDRTFLTTLHRRRFSPQAFPLFMFQCRIAPKTSANLYLRTPKAETAIPLQNLNAKADNRWHSVMVNFNQLATTYPALRNTDITAIAIGNKDKLTAPQQLRLDNVALVPALPPVQDVWFSASDATGIQTYLGQLSRAPVPLNPQLTRLKGAGMPNTMLTEAGLWYLNLACQDGAGNTSETIHVPFWCDQPVPPDAQDARNPYLWQLLPANPKQHRVLRMSLHKLSAANHGQTRQLLMLRLQKGRTQPAFLVEKLPLTRSRIIIADLFFSGQEPASMHLRPVILDAKRRLLLQGKDVTLSPKPQWQRNMRFCLPDTTLQTIAGPCYIGWRLQCEQKQPARMLIQNIRIAPTIP